MRKARAIEYEEYLKRIAQLAQRIQTGKAESEPATLDSPGKRALYNNLKVQESRGGYQPEDDTRLRVALRIDEVIKAHRRDAWRGNLPREREIKSVLYEILGDTDEVERIFLIVKAQGEY